MRLIRIVAIGLVVTALTVALSVQAQQQPPRQVLTLDDCIELALKNRESIIRARGAADLAKWDKMAALGAFLPQVSASYDYSESRERDIESEQNVIDSAGVYRDTLVVRDARTDSLLEVPVLRDTIFSRSVQTIDFPDQDRTSKSLSLSASMSLFDLTNWFNLAAASADKARAHLDVIKSEQDLIYSVKTSYYLYLAAVERISVDSQAVERSAEQLKLIESKFELGSASKSDVLKQKVQYGNDRLSLLQAKNAVTTTRADLAYTIGINPNSEVRFSTDYTLREYDGTLDNAMLFGLDHQPSLLAAGKSVDAARHAVKSRWASYLPTVSGFASYSISDGTRGDTVTFDFSSNSRTFGFRVSWNIFDGFWRERQLAGAKISLNNARAAEVDVRNFTISSIKSAYLEIEQLQEQKAVAQENVDAANEDLKITQEKYNLGAATILDLLDAQVSLREAQVALIRADFDLNLAVAQLENAMGKM